MNVPGYVVLSIKEITRPVKQTFADSSKFFGSAVFLQLTVPSHGEGQSGPSPSAGEG